MMHVLEEATLWTILSLRKNSTSFINSIVNFWIGCGMCDCTKCITFRRLQMVQTVPEVFRFALKISIIIWSHFWRQNVGKNVWFQKSGSCFWLEKFDQMTTEFFRLSKVTDEDQVSSMNIKYISFDIDARLGKISKWSGRFPRRSDQLEKYLIVTWFNV